MLIKSKFLPFTAALLLLAGLALASILFVGDKPGALDPRSPGDASGAEPPAKLPAEAGEVSAAATGQDPAPPEILAARAELHAEFAKQKAKMPEELAKPMENEIGIIEGAAAEILAAIASEPDNEDLKMMLIETYRNEMKLLKKALHLSSAEDEAATEEATPAAP